MNTKTMYLSVPLSQVPVGVPFEAQEDFGIVDVVDWDSLPEDERASPNSEPARARALPWGDDEVA